MEKQYLQFDINDERAGLIAEVLANKTCKKILSLLADKEMSESDIAKRLNIPANTANYNMQKLVASGLVEQGKKFFWSTKGKKVTLYRLSNKKVIISPKTSFRGILPAVIATGLVALGLRIFTTDNVVGNDEYGQSVGTTREIAASKMAESSSYAMDSAANMMGDAAIQQVGWSSVAPWSWFLLGAWAALLIFVLFNLRRGSS